MSQSRVNDQPAFILHRRDFRDSSLILDMFTRDHGRVTMIARGARKRRDSAMFQPFNRLSIGWSGSAELKTLTAIEAVPLSLPADCYLAAYYVNEVLLYLLHALDAHEDIFHAYQRLLLEMDRANMQAILRGFEMDLLTSLGLMPDLSVEARDNQRVSREGRYRVEPELGVMSSGPGDAQAFAGDELLAIQERRFEDERVRRTARRLLGKIIDFHLHGRTLQSRKLYQQMYSRRSS